MNVKSNILSEYSLDEARIGLLGHVPENQFSGGLKTVAQSLKIAFSNMEVFPLSEWTARHIISRYHSKIWYVDWFKNDFIYSRYLLEQHRMRPFDLLFTYSCTGSFLNKTLLDIPVIHIHCGCLVDFVKQTTEKPLDALIHGTILKRIEKKSSNGKCCVAISEQVKNEVKQHYGHNSDVIPLGIDLDCFFPMDKHEIRRELNCRENVPVGLYVGRAEYAKGWDVLLDVAGRLPHVNFVCITDLAKEPVLDNVIIKNNVPTHELNKWYNSADFFILPSRYESASLVTLEAMSCNLPVIISKEVANVICADMSLSISGENEGIYTVDEGGMGYVRAIEASLKNKNVDTRCLVQEHHSMQSFCDKYRKLAADLLCANRVYRETGRCRVFTGG